jgi:hypothetical protein
MLQKVTLAGARKRQHALNRQHAGYLRTAYRMQKGGIVSTAATSQLPQVLQYHGKAAHAMRGTKHTLLKKTRLGQRHREVHMRPKTHSKIAVSPEINTTTMTDATLLATGTAHG